MLYFLTIIQNGKRTIAAPGMPRDHAVQIMRKIKVDHPEYKILMHDFDGMFAILSDIIQGAPELVVEQLLEQVMQYGGTNLDVSNEY